MNRQEQVPDELPKGISISEELLRKREHLLDLTRSNRLLNYRRSKKQSLQIVDELPDEIWDRLIAGRYFEFKPLPEELTQGDQSGLEWEDDEQLRFAEELPIHNAGVRLDARHTDNKLQTLQPSESLDAILKGMRQQANASIAETGVNVLHLALGLLEWYEANYSSTANYAPLLLVPVSLNRDFVGGKYRYRLSYTGEEIQVNQSLGLKLQQDFNLNLPDIDDGMQPEDYFRAVGRAVSSETKWGVKREALLGFFSFRKLMMYRDLDPAKWGGEAGLGSSGVIGSLVAGASSDESEPETLFRPDYDIDEHGTAHDIPLALDADSSQHSALCDIIAGQNMVIEGPPGTGKSQTITNAIAAALGQGKTVMFVAEKLAALRVVYQNLAKIGLGAFCLELHSESAKPAKVYEDLKKRLEMKFPRSMDVEHKRLKVEREKEKISNYIAATDMRCGPIKERLDQVFWRAAGFRQRGIDPLHGAGVPGCDDEQTYDSCVAALDTLQRHGDEVGPAQKHAWRGIDLQSYRPAQAENLTRVLENWSTFAQDIDGTSASLHKIAALGFEDWLTLSEGWDADAAQRLLDVQVPDRDNARACLPREQRESLRDLVEQVRVWQDVEKRYLAEALVSWEESEPIADQSVTAWNAVVNRLPPETKPSDVHGLRARLEGLQNSHTQLGKTADTLEGLGHLKPRTPKEFADAVDRHRLMHHPAMADSSNLLEVFFHTQAEVAYKRARQRHDGLLQAEQRIGEVLSLRDIPELEVVSKLRRELQPYAQRRLRGISPKFRRIRRSLQEFLSPGASRRLTDQLVALNHYEELVAAKQKFASDSRCAEALGPSFAGTETDWESLKQSIAWCKTVRARGIGYVEAQSLLERRDQINEAVGPEVMQQRLEAVTHEINDPLVRAVLGLEEGLTETISFAELEEQISIALSACRDFESAVRCFRPTTGGVLQNVLSSLKNVQKGSEARRRVAEAGRKTSLGVLFKGVETDVDAIEGALHWLVRAEALGMPRLLLQQILAGDIHQTCIEVFGHMDTLRVQRSRWDELRRELGGFGGLDDGVLASPADSQNEEPCRARLHELMGELDGAAGWANCCRARRAANTLGLSDFCDAFFAGRIEAGSLSDTYRASVYHRVGDAAIDGNPALAGFSRQALEDARLRFRHLDTELLELNRQAIAAVAGGHRRPAGVSRGRVGELTEMGLIHNEINKQRRHCRIRRLVERAPNSLKALKPCFMLSPLSVAQFLPPGSIEFDLVVMDEASQIKPEDALGTAIRAKQLVVVGDPKQLPPTSFFDKLSDGTEVDEEQAVSMDDTESVLEVAMKGFRNHRRLRWHYRSKHPSLIDFSNKKFYDDELVVFPSPTSETGDQGVRFNYVEGGFFQGGGNVKEADSVARAVIKHAREHPEKTLGVGTFNAKQRELIEDRLDTLCSEDAEVRRYVDALRDPTNDHPLFIKNLENVQGDERDVMLISYTYGPDEASGKVMQRFGPINGKQGWRRLNVLVTRAKERVEVFSSMNPHDIKPTDRSSLGVEAMREYLEYAHTGMVPDRGLITDRSPDSPFELAVGGVIRELGYQWVPQVGVAGYFIDIGVCSPGYQHDFMLGIECDGATYHSSRSARDRDRLREDVILSRGWYLHRIWSTDWFLNYDDEVRRLKQALEQAAARSSESGRRNHDPLVPPIPVKE
ncbi:MAG: DUF4011 domain-containing protein [Planctomycetota bacterium]